MQLLRRHPRYTEISGTHSMISKMIDRPRAGTFDPCNHVAKSGILTSVACSGRRIREPNSVSRNRGRNTRQLSVSILSAVMQHQRNVSACARQVVRCMNGFAIPSRMHRITRILCGDIRRR